MSIGLVLLGGVHAVGVRQTVHELAPFWGATVRFTAAGLIMAVGGAIILADIYVGAFAKALLGRAPAPTQQA